MPRNLVRHVLLPSLEARVPHAAAALARHAEIAREEAAWLAGLVNPLVERFVHQGDGRVAIDGALAAEPPAVQRRVLLAGLRAAGVRHPGLDEVEAVRGLWDGGGAVRDLPGGVRADRIGASVVLSIEGPGHDAGGPAYRYSLIPAKCGCPRRQPWSRPCRGAETPARGSSRASRLDEVDVDSDVLGPAVVVRNWQAGDLIGRRGSAAKKLQDVFVWMRKLPSARAAAGSLLVDGPKNRVLWVPGLAIDERLRVTSGTKAVVADTESKAAAGGRPE